MQRRRKKKRGEKIVANTRRELGKNTTESHQCHHHDGRKSLINIIKANAPGLCMFTCKIIQFAPETSQNDACCSINSLPLLYNVNIGVRGTLKTDMRLSCWVKKQRNTQTITGRMGIRLIPRTAFCLPMQMCQFTNEYCKFNLFTENIQKIILFLNQV